MPVSTRSALTRRRWSVLVVPRARRPQDACTVETAVVGVERPREPQVCLLRVAVAAKGHEAANRRARWRRFRRRSGPVGRGYTTAPLERPLHHRIRPRAPTLGRCRAWFPNAGHAVRSPRTRPLRRRDSRSPRRVLLDHVPGRTSRQASARPLDIASRETRTEALRRRERRGTSGASRGGSSHLAPRLPATICCAAGGCGSTHG
jgi:hypothetical protein